MDSGSTTTDFPADGGEYFFDIAIQDARYCLEEAFQTGAPRHKRSAVQAVFAFIDGCHEFVRGHVRSQASAYRQAYSVADLAVLREESPYVDERGNVRVRPLRVPLLTSIKALVKLIEKNDAAQHTVDLSHPGYGALSRAIMIRNRIVHPKSAKDLDLCETEMHDVSQAFNWYIAFALRVGQSTSEALHAQVNRCGVLPTVDVQRSSS